MKRTFVGACMMAAACLIALMPTRAGGCATTK